MNRKIFEEYYNVNFSVDKSIASKLPKLGEKLLEW